MSDAFDPYLEWLGIEPHEHPPDHYRLLGIARFERDRRMIEAAADQRMAYVRSFQTGPRVKFTQKMLNELAGAKLCLLNPNTKTTYDAVLEGRLAASGAGIAPGPSALPHDLLPPSALGAEATQFPHATATVGPPRRGEVWHDAGVPQPPPPPTQPHSATPAAPPSTAAKATAGEDAQPQDDNPLYTRPWFPFVVVAAIVLVAGLVWGIGRTLNKPVAESEPPVEVPDEPSEPVPPVVEEPLPPDPVVINQEESGAINFQASVATLHGDNLQLKLRGSESVIEGWTSEQDWLSWEFKVVSLPANPFFKVLITYAADEDAVGGRYGVAIDGEKEVSGTIPANRKPNEFHTDELIVSISRTGRHRLSLRAKEKPGEELMVVKSISLQPVKAR